MSRAHRHDDLELNAPLGDLEYVAGGRTVTITAGTVAMFWAGRPHQLVAGEGVRTTWITVPMAVATSWPGVRRSFADLVAGDVLIAPDDLGVAERARTWLHELSDPDQDARRAAVLEVEALVTRVVRSKADATSAVAPADPLADDRSRIMARLVADRFREPLGVGDVAAAVGLHPQTATRVFRAAVGVSIPAYVEQCRIGEAQRLLMSTALPVDEVGRRAGFGSASTFHAVFARSTGTTPLAFRRARRA